MRHITKAGVGALMAAVALIGSAAPAQAEDNYFAVVTVNNTTSNVTIHYSFRWGDDDTWQSYTLKPGETRWHSYAYDFPNQNRSPAPMVKFWNGINRKRVLQQYSLEAYAAPDKGAAYGMPYDFVVVRDDEDYVDLRKK
jgi:hypothetical protein